MNPQLAHIHRKNNSNSVNNHALMSGKQQLNLSGANNPLTSNFKFVKPSELSLDLISPTHNLRNLGQKKGG